MPNDFISREVFAEYLRDKIATSMADGANEAAIALIETLVKLRAIPPADVVPVVRCGECSHRAANIVGDGMVFCKHLETLVPLAHFCGYGECKDGGEHHAD